MYEMLLKNCHIVDGTGKAPYTADIAIKNAKIAAIKPDINGDALKVLDIGNSIVTPGFIDTHRHSEAYVFKKGFAEAEIRQGITTSINGNCGLSIPPCPKEYKEIILSYLKPITGSLPNNIEFETFSDFMNILEDQPLAINFGMHIGNGTLRSAVKGFEKGELNNKEIAKLHYYLNDAIDSGAFGVSMGIVYMPENMYTHKEFVKALEPIRGKDIPIVTHIRGEGDLLLESINEVINIAKELEIPIHISHFKCVGRHNWGSLLSKAIDILDCARAEGLKVTCDVYPWTAGSTQLVQVLPPEYLEGGVSKTVERLTNKKERKKCKEILKKKQTRFENLIASIGWESIMLTTLNKPENLQYIGMTVSQIAEIQGKDPYDCAFDILVEENCNVSMVNFIVCDDDIDTILKYPYSAIISDSIYPDSGIAHPRRFGTYAKILEEYVKDRGVLTLQEAVHKLSGFPAEIFAIKGKGFLKEGYDADINIFKLENIKNNAEYTNSMQFAEGFEYVFINGHIVNDHDKIVKNDAGKVIRR